MTECCVCEATLMGNYFPILCSSCQKEGWEISDDGKRAFIPEQVVYIQTREQREIAEAKARLERAGYGISDPRLFGTGENDTPRGMR